LTFIIDAKKKKKEFIMLYNIRNYYILLPLRLGVFARVYFLNNIRL